jgi:magnesium and cobalt exporter, CNNM family
MVLLLFYVSLALGVSFLCSIMEAVLLSVSPSFVARFAAEGTAVGRQLEALKKEVDRPLAAILSLNTIAHTVGAAGAGAQAATVFGSAFLGLASGILTFLILVFSEIIPKTLGALYWRSLTPTVVRILVPIMWAMWPLVKMAQGLTFLMSRGKTGGTMRRDEFPALADVGVREGVLHAEESRMVRSLLQFGELRVEDVMTPRTVLFALPSSSTVGEVLESNPRITFSRVPIYGESIDEVSGLVLRHDLLLAAARNETSTTLNSLRRDIMTVSPSLGLRTLLDKLRSARSHMALVVSEYGGTMGVVTLEDAIETLIGLEIMDEVDTVEDMRVLARQKWRDRALEMGIDPDAATPVAPD